MLVSPILYPDQVLTTVEMVPVLDLAKPFLLGRGPAGLDADRPRAIALALAHAWIDAETTTAVFTLPILLFFDFLVSSDKLLNAERRANECRAM